MVTSGLGPRAECSQALRYLYPLHASPRGPLPCSLARGAGSVVSMQRAGRWSGKRRKELGREGKEGPSSWEFQVWKNCWSICVLRDPLAVSVRLTNSWVTCRVREPAASRRWVPRVSPSAREEIGRAMCSSLPLSAPALHSQEPRSPALGDSPVRKGSVAVLWVVVILLYSLCSGFWKSPEWLPSCGKGPRAGRSVGQGGTMQRQGQRRAGVSMGRHPTSILGLDGDDALTLRPEALSCPGLHLELVRNILTEARYCQPALKVVSVHPECGG